MSAHLAEEREAMARSIEHIGPRLKEIRQGADLSLREVARQLEVSPSFVSQIENGKSQPSVATLYGFATLFGVPMDALFESNWNGKTTASSKVSPEIVKKDESTHPHAVWDESQARISTVSPGNRSLITTESGIQWERLAATTEKSVNFMEIVYEPGTESLDAGALATHHGYEYAYALEGEVEVVIGDLMLTLSKNHSIGFDSSIPHKFRNVGTVTFRGIWFVHWCDGPRDWKLVK
ncbi:MAG: helix-turn-helix domain-containing protein [Candidatus Nanopelagicaceae bacterium]